MALAAAALAASTSIAAAGDRFECKAETVVGDASMDAGFRQDGDRAKFDSSFEAAPGGSFQAGDILEVRVGGELVGAIALEAALNGDVGGDLNLDTTAGPGDNDSPFPANFPGVGAGTIVTVGTLGCSLQAR